MRARLILVVVWPSKLDETSLRTNDDGADARALANFWTGFTGLHLFSKPLRELRQNQFQTDYIISPAERHPSKESMLT